MSTNHSAPTRHAVIIGAGFSGVLTAVHLLRNPAIRVTLIERAGRFGPGTAYSTPSPVHYLNVPAGNMSAFADEPGHFLTWAQQRDPAIVTGSFPAREVYGAYLEHVIETARATAGGRLATVSGEAVAVERFADGAWHVRLRQGNPIAADRVVLAFGNAAPPTPPGLAPELRGHPGYVANPWMAAAFEPIRADEPVLIVGAGLTMMDAAMTLQARDHAGRIVAISRHGLMPRPHRSPSRPPAHKAAPEALASWNGSARGLLHILRRAVEDNATRGADWRDVITSIRPITAQLWGKLSQSERQRFLDRLRSYWDIVRHRAAPETAAVISDLLASRRLVVRAGRIHSIRLCTDQSGLIDVRFRPRGSENMQMLRVARVINCLGPETNVHRTEDPLMAHLLSAGLVAPDAHGLGLQVSERGEAVGADGNPIPSIFVIGPCRRAQVWENTAVPELRKQAAAVAAEVAK